MAKRTTQKGWILPNPILGYDTICYCVPIPNVPEYRAAFLGTVNQLGKYWNWEMSGQPDDRRATEVASYFRQLFEDITVSNCASIILQQNPVNPCQLMQSVDSGLTWTLAFDYGLCLPTSYEYRYNEDTGIYERSSDGGLTWEDNTENDNRFNAPATGITGSGDLRCKSAENVTAYLQAIIDEIDNAIETGATIVVLMGIVTAVIAAILTGGLAIPIAISLISALLFLGSEGIDDTFTIEFWEELKCYIYCHGREDGKYTYANWNELQSGIETEFPTPAGTIIKYLIWLMGSSGLTNTGAIGTSLGESCETCDCGVPWVYIWSNNPDELPMSTVAACSWDAPNRWYEGIKTCGWNSATSSVTVNVQITFPLPTNITRLKERIQNQVAEPFNAREQYIQVKPVGGEPYKVAQMFQSGTGTWLLDSGDINVDAEWIRFVTSAKLTANRTPENSNFTRLKEIEVQGTDYNPFEV